MNNLPDIPDGGNSKDVRDPDVFETPFEAEVLGDDLPDDRRTVSPDEEGPEARGLHGSWHYEHDNTEKGLVGIIDDDLEDSETLPDLGAGS